MSRWCQFRQPLPSKFISARLKRVSWKTLVMRPSTRKTTSSPKRSPSSTSTSATSARKTTSSATASTSPPLRASPRTNPSPTWSSRCLLSSRSSSNPQNKWSCHPPPCSPSVPLSRSSLNVPTLLSSTTLKPTTTRLWQSAKNYTFASRKFSAHLT